MWLWATTKSINQMRTLSKVTMTVLSLSHDSKPSMRNTRRLAPPLVASSCPLPWEHTSATNYESWEWVVLRDSIVYGELVLYVVQITHRCPQMSFYTDIFVDVFREKCRNAINYCVMPTSSLSSILIFVMITLPIRMTNSEVFVSCCPASCDHAVVSLCCSCFAQSMSISQGAHTRDDFSGICCFHYLHLDLRILFDLV